MTDHSATERSAFAAWVPLTSPAELRVTEASDIQELKAVESLFVAIWGEERLPVARDLLQALKANGNYVAVARAADELLGACVGFFGRDDGHGLHLHSHILGVRADAQVHGVGYRLKQHQRSWALERGIDVVTWTFDPLVRRNAYFNITKLGATPAEYLVNFYEAMGDRINGNGQSDRLLARWLLTSPPAVDAARDVTHAPSVDRELERGARWALRQVDGAPVVERVGGRTILIELPDDIVALRATHPDVAAAWPGALRATLGSALRDGWRVTGMSRTGVYVVERPAG